MDLPAKIARAVAVADKDGGRALKEGLVVDGGGSGCGGVSVGIEERENVLNKFQLQILLRFLGLSSSTSDKLIEGGVDGFKLVVPRRITDRCSFWRPKAFDDREVGKVEELREVWVVASSGFERLVVGLEELYSSLLLLVLELALSRHVPSSEQLRLHHDPF